MADAATTKALSQALCDAVCTPRHAFIEQRLVGAIDDAAAACHITAGDGVCCVELDLRNGDAVVDPAVLKAVLDARGTLVTNLNVRGCLFTVLGGLESLAAVLERCPNITFIDVADNDVGPGRAVALGAALARGTKLRAKLRAVDVSGNGLEPEGGASLVGALEVCEQLRHLDISGNNLRSSGGEALGAALSHWPYFDSLHASNNHLGPSGAAAVCSGLAECAHVHDLRIADNDLGPAGGETLRAEVRYWPRLRSLDISKNGLESSCEGVVETLHACGELRHLWIGGNLIGPSGGTALGAALPHWPHLETLSTPANDLGASGSNAIANGLAQCPNLHSLDMSSNDLGPEGGEGLGSGLAHCKRLRTLDASNNSLRRQGVEALALGLKECSTIATVSVKRHGGEVAPLCILALHPGITVEATCDSLTQGAECVLEHRGAVLPHHDASGVTSWQPELLFAATSAHFGGAVTHLLLRAGVGCDTPLRCPGVDHSTLLMHCARRRDANSVEELLRHGANPCSADGNGDTALHYACKGVGGGVDDKTWLRILHMLLFAGAKLWTHNGSSMTAVQEAKRSLQDYELRHGTGSVPNRLHRIVAKMALLSDCGPSLTMYSNGSQAISRRVFGADDFAEATGPTHTPPLSLDPDKPTRILATYRHPRPQDGWAAAGGLLDKVEVVVTVLMPLIQALYNFVDVVLDVVVARQLAVGGDHLLAVASATITFITLAVSVYMLAAERQYAAAICQALSLGGLYNAVAVLTSASHEVEVDFAQATPLFGKHAILQLRNFEAVAEAAPQLVLQLFAAVITGYTTTLVVSLSLSMVSLAMALAMSDRTSVSSHAAQQLGRVVLFPVGVALVKGNLAIDLVTGAMRRGVHRIRGYYIHFSGHFIVVAAFRAIEVVARLGTAALMFAVVRQWALVALAIAFMSSAACWFGTLPLQWLLLAKRRPSVWREVTARMPLPSQLSFTRVLVALAYCTIAFPGVGEVPIQGTHSNDGSGQFSEGDTPRTASGRDSEGTVLGADTGINREASARTREQRVALTIEPWMQPLWTRDWSVTPRAFLLLRMVEQAVMLCTVPIAGGGAFLQAHSWEMGSVVLCSVLYIPMFLCYIKLCRGIPEREWFVHAPSMTSPIATNTARGVTSPTPTAPVQTIACLPARLRCGGSGRRRLQQVVPITGTPFPIDATTPGQPPGQTLGRDGVAGGVPSTAWGPRLASQNTPPPSDGVGAAANLEATRTTPGFAGGSAVVDIEPEPRGA